MTFRSRFHLLRSSRVCRLSAVAEELILPVFALNAENPDGSRWSTEVYLVNPTPDPVSVAIAGLLPGRVNRPTPCGQFMSPTRVVPPQSAVLWTASGLATDLGCAEEVLGALKLHADGPVRCHGAYGAPLRIPENRHPWASSPAMDSRWRALRHGRPARTDHPSAPDPALAPESLRRTRVHHQRRFRQSRARTGDRDHVSSEGTTARHPDQRPSGSPCPISS